MKSYDSFSASYAEAAATWAAFRAAIDESKQISVIVGARIAADQAADKSRIENLKQTPGQSETAIRMTALELQRLESKHYSATPEEQAAFDDSIATAKQALHDYRQAQATLREVYKSFIAEAESMRVEILANPYLIVVDNWLSGVEKDFSRYRQED